MSAKVRTGLDATGELIIMDFGQIVLAPRLPLKVAEKLAHDLLDLVREAKEKNT